VITVIGLIVFYLFLYLQGALVVSKMRSFFVQVSGLQGRKASQQQTLGVRAESRRWDTHRTAAAGVNEAERTVRRAITHSIGAANQSGTLGGPINAKTTSIVGDTVIGEGTTDSGRIAAATGIARNIVEAGGSSALGIGIAFAVYHSERSFPFFQYLLRSHAILSNRF
jgi:hypothetical protein